MHLNAISHRTDLVSAVLTYVRSFAYKLNTFTRVNLQCKQYTHKSMTVRQKLIFVWPSVELTYKFLDRNVAIQLKIGLLETKFAMQRIIIII